MRIIINQSIEVGTVVSILERQVEERLAETGVRFTGGRRRVVATLDRSGGPMSAFEVYQALDGTVPVSSVYRTLAVLEEAGVVEPHHSAKGLTRYEMAEWLAGHHHHLVCQVCGAVEDIELPRGLEVDLEQLVHNLSDLSGFSASAHSLEVVGHCPRCR